MKLEEVLSPQDIGGEDSLEAQAAIERISKYLNRDDFTTAPAPLKLAARTLAASLGGASGRAAEGVITRETSDDVTVAYDASATQTQVSGLTSEVQAMVAPYRYTPGI